MSRQAVLFYQLIDLKSAKQERFMYSMGWLMWIGASPRETGPGTIIEYLNKIVWNEFFKGGGIYSLRVCGWLAWPRLNGKGLNGACWSGGDTGAGCCRDGCTLFNHFWMAYRKRSIRRMNFSWVNVLATATRLFIAIILN